MRVILIAALVVAPGVAAAADTVPPQLTITAPKDQSTVAPGFIVTATATDDIGVTRATLRIDDQVAGTMTGAGPFTFMTSDALAAGGHMVEVEVGDTVNVTTKIVIVNLQRNDPGGDDDPGGGGGGGCSAGGDAGILLGLAALVARRPRRPS